MVFSTRFPGFPGVPFRQPPSFLCAAALELNWPAVLSPRPLPSPSYLKLHFYATSLDWFPEKPLSPTVQLEFQGVRPSPLIAILPV